MINLLLVGVGPLSSNGLDVRMVRQEKEYRDFAVYRNEARSLSPAYKRGGLLAGSLFLGWKASVGISWLPMQFLGFPFSVKFGGWFGKFRMPPDSPARFLKTHCFALPPIFFAVRFLLSGSPFSMVLSPFASWKRV